MVDDGPVPTGQDAINNAEYRNFIELVDMMRGQAITVLDRYKSPDRDEYTRLFLDLTGYTGHMVHRQVMSADASPKRRSISSLFRRNSTMSGDTELVDNFNKQVRTVRNRLMREPNEELRTVLGDVVTACEILAGPDMRTHPALAPLRRTNLERAEFQSFIPGGFPKEMISSTALEFWSSIRAQRQQGGSIGNPP